MYEELFSDMFVFVFDVMVEKISEKFIRKFDYMLGKLFRSENLINIFVRIK